MSTTAYEQELPMSASGTYNIDPSHSRIGFIARHAMITKVRGSFNEFTGSGHFDAANPANSSLELTIQVSSVDTRNADRDGHLLSPDFFDVATFPTITFVSTAVRAGGDDTYVVTDDLTIKGVTKSIDLEVELTGTVKDPFGNERLGLEGNIVVNRKDWDLSWNAVLDAGGVLLGEKVTLEFEASAIKQAA